jgi:hypothetical protein
MNDKEKTPLEYQSIRVRERAPDKYDLMYLARVKAKQIEHLSSRRLWNNRKMESPK